MSKSKEIKDTEKMRSQSESKEGRDLTGLLRLLLAVAVDPKPNVFVFPGFQEKENLCEFNSEVAIPHCVIIWDS